MLSHSSDPAPVTATDVEAEIYGNYFVAEGVPSNCDGDNEIIAQATDAVGRTGQDTAIVLRDAQPPEIEDEIDGSELGACSLKPLLCRFPPGSQLAALGSKLVPGSQFPASSWLSAYLPPPLKGRRDMV